MFIVSLNCFKSIESGIPWLVKTTSLISDKLRARTEPASSPISAASIMIRISGGFTRSIDV